MCDDSFTVKCDRPLLADNAVEVLVGGSDYRDPALEGATITFTCHSGLHDMVLTGPNTSTCMDNGKWEPDPRDAQCKGILYIIMRQSPQAYLSYLVRTYQ